MWLSHGLLIDVWLGDTAVVNYLGWGTANTSIGQHRRYIYIYICTRICRIWTARAEPNRTGHWSVTVGYGPGPTLLLHLRPSSFTAGFSWRFTLSYRTFNFPLLLLLLLLLGLLGLTSASSSSNSSLCVRWPYGSRCFSPPPPQPSCHCSVEREEVALTL